MYSYTYDEETGGILLNTNLTEGKMSKEPRPVYAAELDILGFDKFWNYDKQNDFPYMWAEANVYFYRGRKVASLKGKDYSHTPKIIFEDSTGTYEQPEPNGVKLRKIDIEKTIKKNRELLGVLESTTVKKIRSIYEKYRDRLDCFHVAFSGGKDSIVLLDLVKKTLPKSGYVVVFANTQLEFPDTLHIIEQTRIECEKENISFYEARPGSELKPEYLWRVFGPPSRELRWCCSVYKSAPQTLLLRQLTEKADFQGLDFVGVRKYESFTRSKYDEENFGKKQQGQYSHHSILDWTSAEVWLYTFANKLHINEAYKKGCNRVGCIICPMTNSPVNLFIRRQIYRQEIDKYIDIIKSTYVTSSYMTEKDVESYFKNGGWSSRRSGDRIQNNFQRYFEYTKDGISYFELKNPSSDVREWMKTISVEPIDYSMKVSEDGSKVVVSVPETKLKQDSSFGKKFRVVLKKATYCVACRVCESNCRRGCLHFENGKLKIENCVHCLDCHKVPAGCLMYNSMKVIHKVEDMDKEMIDSVVDKFNGHAPEKKWFEVWFTGIKNNEWGNLKDKKDLKEKMEEKGLSSKKYYFFYVYLSDSGLFDEKREGVTSFANLIASLDWDSPVSQGLLLINLVDQNTEFQWLVKQLKINVPYTKQDIYELVTKDRSVDTDAEEKRKTFDRYASHIISDYKKLISGPLGTGLHFGFVEMDEKKKTSVRFIGRSRCVIPNALVLLYGLYKFAEKNEGIREFSLSSLMEEDCTFAGISPTKLFGLSQDETITMLKGLSTNYSTFIRTTFTHNLDVIVLDNDKSSEDVLELFKFEV